MECPDQDLVARAQAGDREAFAELVRRYQARIYNLAYRLLQQREEAQDAAQEVFLRAYRALNRYRPEQSFASWLHAIANNYCVDVVRRRRRRPLSVSGPAGQDDPLPLEIPDHAANPEKLFASGEIQRAIEAAVASLPYKYRVVTVLRHMQGLSYQEISTITGQPEGTVKAQIFRARRLLREKLRDVG
ncbi:MAG: RNA polymerase sigma factor [Bacteroidota bacterium]